MKRLLLIGFFICVSILGYAQSDTIALNSKSKKLTFEGDFRFRVEQDWNSLKSNGSFRTNRTRFRYRLRAGFNYNLNEWASFGARIRTGIPTKQQDSQLTLGDGFGEYASLPIGFEKVFFKAQKNGMVIWLGKNHFPFEKNNELFWSDNIYPDGIFIAKKKQFSGPIFSDIKLSLGHFIMNSSGTSLDQDSYLQAAQLTASFFDKRLLVFPSFYFFKNMSNIPDGFGAFNINYEIFHFGSKAYLLPQKNVKVSFDFYNNLRNYAKNDSIHVDLKSQTQGWVIALRYGQLKKKNDWLIELTHAHIDRYAVVDYMAQNDWGRWDYAGAGSLDGRLTNFRGITLTAGYAINEKMSVKLKYYKIEELVTISKSKETGDRIRLDLDIKF